MIKRHAEARVLDALHDTRILALVKALQRQALIAVDGKKVSYTLP